MSQSLTSSSALIAMATECVTLLDNVTAMLGTHLQSVILVEVVEVCTVDPRMKEDVSMCVILHV